MGDNDGETLSNVTHGEFDFEDDSFEAISEDAKEFIDHLLVKDKRYGQLFFVLKGPKKAYFPLGHMAAFCLDFLRNRWNCVVFKHNLPRRTLL